MLWSVSRPHVEVAGVLHRGRAAVTPSLPRPQGWARLGVDGGRRSRKKARRRAASSDRTRQNFWGRGGPKERVENGDAGSSVHPPTGGKASASPRLCRGCSRQLAGGPVPAVSAQNTVPNVSHAGLSHGATMSLGIRLDDRLRRVASLDCRFRRRIGRATRCVWSCGKS